MSHPFQRLTDVVGYTFRPDLYCPGCTLIVAAEQPLASGVEAQLDLIAARSGVDRQDERSFDSGDFPKVLFQDQVEPDDRCSACGGLLRDLEGAR